MGASCSLIEGLIFFDGAPGSDVPVVWSWSVGEGDGSGSEVGDTEAAGMR